MATHNIEFLGQDLVVHLEDGVIKSIYLDEHNGYTPVLALLHPDYIEKIKTLLP